MSRCFLSFSLLKVSEMTDSFVGSSPVMEMMTMSSRVDGLEGGQCRAFMPFTCVFFLFFREKVNVLKKNNYICSLIVAFIHERDFGENN